MIKNIIAYLLMGIISFSYEYVREINIQGEHEYKEFYIPREIYKNSESNLGDLRILNSSGEEVPYALEGTTEKSGIKNIYKGVVTEVKEERGRKLTTIKIERSEEMRDILGDTLEVFSEDNFYSEYTLFVCYNGLDWKKIKEGEIYRTPTDKMMKIKFSKEKYPYYRLATPLNQEITLTGGELSLEVTEEERFPKETVDLSYEVIDLDRETRLLIDSENLPLKSLVIDVAGEFSRNYRLESEDRYLISRGRIYNFQGKQSMAIPIKIDYTYRNLVLKIINNDNKPLKIKNIHGEYYPVKLIFKGEENERYIIAVGDDELSKPRYDLEKYVKNIDKRNQATLGGRVELQQKEKDYKVLYYILFIGVVVLMLIGYICKKIIQMKH